MKTTDKPTTTCQYCGKTFQTAGISNHINVKHGYDIYLRQRAREAKEREARATASR
jgi:hypothetical protein